MALLYERLANGNLKLLSIRLFTDFGRTAWKEEEILLEVFTIIFESKFGLNFSSPSLCLDNPISVSVTNFAFLENHSVKTIINPEIISKNGSAGTFFDKTSMENSLDGIPETDHASNEW